VPTVAAFYGIIVSMYWREHAPPHFHASYGGMKAIVRIEDGEVIAGQLPPTARRIVRDWALARQAELRHNWERGVKRQAFMRIPGPDHD